MRVRRTPSRTESANAEDEKAAPGEGAVTPMCQARFHPAANGTRTKQMNDVTNNYQSFQGTKGTLQTSDKTTRQFE